MREITTKIQLEELNLDEKEKLRNLWIPKKCDRFVYQDIIYTTEFSINDMVCNERTAFEKSACLPLLSIGQCLEILEQNFACISIYIIPKIKEKFCLHLWKSEEDFEDEPIIIYSENNIDAFWEGVKLVL